MAQTTTRPRPTQPLGSLVLAKICILFEKMKYVLLQGDTRAEAAAGVVRFLYDLTPASGY